MGAQQFTGVHVSLRRYGQEDTVRNQHCLSHFRVTISGGRIMSDGIPVSEADTPLSECRQGAYLCNRAPQP